MNMTKTLSCRSCNTDVLEFSSYSVNQIASDGTTLKEIFQTGLGYQILPEQPQQFCDSCRKVLIEWHKFKLVCHRTQDLYGTETIWCIEKGPLDIKTESLIELEEQNEFENESEVMDIDYDDNDDFQNEDFPSESLETEDLSSQDVIKVRFRMFIRNYGQQLTKHLSEVGLVTIEGTTIERIMHEVWLNVSPHINRRIVFDDDDNSADDAPKWHKDEIVLEKHLTKFILFKDVFAKRTYDAPNLHRFQTWSNNGDVIILFIYPYSKSIQTLLHWKIANAALINPDPHELIGLMRKYKNIMKAPPNIVTLKAYIRYYQSQNLTENYLGNFTITATDLRTFSHNLWQFVRSHIKKEVTFDENSKATCFETSPKECDLTNFVSFYNVTGKRTYDLESLTNQILLSWAQKEIILTIFPYSTSVRTKDLFESAKNIIDIPKIKEKSALRKVSSVPIHIKMTLKAQIRYYRKQKVTEHFLSDFNIGNFTITASDFQTFTHKLWQFVRDHIQGEIIFDKKMNPLLSVNSPKESDLPKFITFFDVTGRRTHNLDYLQSLTEQALLSWTEKEFILTIYPYSSAVENRTMFKSAKNIIAELPVVKKVVDESTRTEPMAKPCRILSNDYILTTLKQINGKKFQKIHDALWKMWTAYIDCFALTDQEKLMNENPPTQLMPFFKPDFYDLPSCSSPVADGQTVKLLTRLKQSKSDQNFLFLGDLTVKGETLEDILDRIWELIHKYLIREAIFTGDDFLSWHKMEKPTRECLPKFISINDPKRKVLFKISEIESTSTDIVERWSNSQILLLNIFPFSASVSSTERLKSLKRYLEINDGTYTIINRLKDIHGDKYVAFDWSWRMWAHYVQGKENENAFEEDPPCELRHLFLSVSLQDTYKSIFDERKNQAGNVTPTFFAKTIYDSLNIKNEDAVDENNLVTCPYSGCDSILKKSTSLRRHLLYCQHNPYLDKKYPCPFEECPRSFAIRYLRTRHLRVCRFNPDREALATRPCPYCSKRVTNVNVHILAKHTQARAVCVCDICGETKSTKYMLRDHIKAVHLQQKYHCDKCPSEYKRKDALYRHIKREHSTKPLKVDIKCDSCSYRTNRHENFNRHIRLHHNPEHAPVNCDTCGKSFICESSLKIHMKVHEATEFPCNVCKHVSKTKRGLQCHMTLHQEKNYECPVCFLEIRSAFEVRMHLKRKHPHYEQPPKGIILKKTSKRRGEIPGLT